MDKDKFTNSSTAVKTLKAWARINDLRTPAAVAVSFSLALLFQYLPFKNLMVDGIYRWHVSQPEFVQGGIELVVLLAGFMLAVALGSGAVGLGAVLVLSALYLRLHQVLEPALTALFYFEIIFSFGWWMRRMLHDYDVTARLRDRYLGAFLTGFTGWSLLAVVLSAFGYGGFVHLRIMTVVVGVLSVTRGVNEPLVLALSRFFLNSAKKERTAAVTLAVIVLAVMAKANTAFDYDSLMYGLRPENVLIGERSFFDNLGLLDTVYYYPKLLELFLVPLSNLGAYSFIYAGNVLLLVLLAMAIYVFLRSLNAPRFESLLITLVTCCLPVVANMAATAKTDIFTTFMIVTCS